MALEATTIGRRRRGRLGRLYYGWWVLFGMVVAMVVAEGVTFGSFGAYVLPLEDHFGWSRAQVSLGFSVTVGVVGATAPLIGRLIDVVGPRRLMLIGAPLCCVSFVLLAFMTELWQWYFYMGISAISLGCIAYIPAQALAVRWFDDHRAVATSLIGASVWMGQLIMLPLVQLLISRLGWEDAFIYSGIMIVGAYTVAFILVRDQPPPGGERAHAHPTAVEADAALSTPPEVSLAGLTARRGGADEAVLAPRVRPDGDLLRRLRLAVAGAPVLSVGRILGLDRRADRRDHGRRRGDLAAGGGVAAGADPPAGADCGGGIAVRGRLDDHALPDRRQRRRDGAARGALRAGLRDGAAARGADDLARGSGCPTLPRFSGPASCSRRLRSSSRRFVAGSIFDNTGSYDYALLLYGICAVAATVIFIVASRVQQPMRARLPSLDSVR